jgi:hypothetical protein
MQLNFKVLNDSNTIKRTKEAYHQLVQSLLHLQLDFQKMFQLHQQVVHLLHFFITKGAVSASH